MIFFRLVLLLSLFCFVVDIPLVYSAKRSDLVPKTKENTQTNISEVKDKIEKLQENLKALKKKKNFTEAWIDKITKKIQSFDEKELSTEDKRRLEAEMKRLREKEAKLRSQIEKQKKHLERMIRSYLRTFESRASGESHWLSWYVDKKQEKDLNPSEVRALLYRFFLVEEKLDQDVARVADQKSALEVEEKKKSLLEKREVYQETLEKLQEQVSEKQLQIARLRRDEKRIEDRMRRLQNVKISKRRAQEFQLTKRSLRLPIQGRVVSDYGRQYDSDLGIYRLNKGLRLRSQDNRKRNIVEAPAPGKIVYEGTIKSYGQVVIVALDPSGGSSQQKKHFYLIGGLNKISVPSGSWVKAGDPLGYSGQEVYIELRQGKDAIDPKPYLAFR